MIRTRKYLELDSTFRNRNQFPSPSDFVVPYQVSGSYNNCIDAFDPVCLSFPFEQNSGATLTTNNTVTLIPFVSSSVDNFYVQQYIGLIDTSVSPYTIQYSKIRSYSGNSRIIVVYGAFSLPLGIYNYVIRKQLPADIPYNTSTETSTILPMTGIVAFAPTVIQLQPTSSTLPDAYKGMSIRLISFVTTPLTEEYRSILHYDDTTHTVTVSRPFSNVFTPLDYYEILPFSRDNLKPLQYQGSSNQQAVCYSVRLVNIAIPFIIRSFTDVNGVEYDERAIIDVANGGTIDQYPYFYVCLYSDIHKDNIQSIISNNPNTSYAVFRVAVSSGDTPGPKKIMSQTCFTRCDMCPIIKFLPNDTFHMTVLLPNGEVLSFRQKDNASPKEPNYKLQISALFEFTRLEA
jgi:hypothetical protein